MRLQQGSLLCCAWQDKSEQATAEEDLSEDEVQLQCIDAGLYSLQCSSLNLGNLWMFLSAARAV